jgi:hypothetical protein
MLFSYKSRTVKAKIEVKPDAIVIAKTKDKKVATKNAEDVKINVDDNKIKIKHN